MSIADISAVPAEFIKSSLVFWAFVVGVAVGLVTIYARLSKSGQKREVHGGPVEVCGEVKVQPKGRRYSAEFDDARHGEVTRRLNGHDKEISDLWNTMRKEDTQTREEMSKCFQSIERSLGRIEGQLKGERNDTGG